MLSPRLIGELQPVMQSKPKHIVDLSLTLRSRLAVYPGDPPIEIRRVRAMPEDEVNILELCLSTHHGTHLDAPSHQINGGRCLDEYPLSKFINHAVKIDLKPGKSGPCTHQKDNILYRRVVTRQDLEVHGDDIAGHGALILHTGYGPVMQQGSVDRDFPYLAADAAQFIRQFEQINILGIDSLSLDAYAAPAEAHRIILSSPQGIILLESLVNLELLPAEFILACFPLSIERSDGAPCRAVAWWDD